MTENWPRDPESYMLEQIKDLDALDTNDLNDETVTAWTNLYTRIHSDKTYTVMWIKTGDGEGHRIFANVDKRHLLSVYKTSLEVYVKKGKLSLMMGKSYDESDVIKLGEHLCLKGDEFIACFHIRNEDLTAEQKGDSEQGKGWSTFRVINFSDLHLPKATPITRDMAKSVLDALNDTIVEMKGKLTSQIDPAEIQSLADNLKETVANYASVKESCEVLIKAEP